MDNSGVLNWRQNLSLMKRSVWNLQSHHLFLTISLSGEGLRLNLLHDWWWNLQHSLCFEQDIQNSLCCKITRISLVFTHYSQPHKLTLASCLYWLQVVSGHFQMFPNCSSTLSSLWLNSIFLYPGFKVQLPLKQLT